jgi:hypothetical protein
MATQNSGFREALELLARRAGITEEPWRPAPSHPRAPVHPEPALPAAPNPALEGYVEACEAWLWSPAGAPMRRWLAGRHLGEAVLRANRVGADPGPRALRRDPGLPRGGQAVVFPLLDPGGRALYLQARYLRPHGRKYDNPSAGLVPASPRVGEMRLPRSACHDDVVIVCEGIPDALTAAQAGHRAVAILGAGLPDQRVAVHLVARHPEERLVVAFDADHRGRAGTARLIGLLAEAGAEGRVHALSVPDEFGDLNGWAQAAGGGFADELMTALHQTWRSARDAVSVPEIQEEGLMLARDHGTEALGNLQRVEVSSNPATPALDDLLETLAYQHLLLDGPTVVSQNLDGIVGALEAWRSGIPLDDLDVHEELADVLERIGYHHVLADDEPAAHGALDAVSQAVDHWLDLVAERAPATRGPVGVADPFGLPATLLPEVPGTSFDGPGFGL